MAEIILKAKIRDYKGRSDANSARLEGKVPGVFYLKNEKNIPIEVEALDLRPLIYTAETHIVNLELSDGESELCILKDVQFDPITDAVTHFDLMGLIKGQKVKFEVPISLEGSPIGLKSGGILTQVLHKVEVECIPTALPEHIAIDISHLDAGQSINVGELVYEGIEILTNPTQSVAIVGHARAEVVEEVEETEEGAEEGTEPEVIGKGKEDEEEA